MLVWWEGQVPARLGVGFGRDEIVDTSYRPVATVNAGNGYQADLHEFQITPSGSAFLTAYSLVVGRPLLRRRPEQRHPPGRDRCRRSTSRPAS